MTDRLTLTRALESSGMQSQAAERIAIEIYDAIHYNVTTKADLRDLEQRLKIWLGSLTIATGGALFAALQYWPAALEPTNTSSRRTPRPGAARRDRRGGHRPIFRALHRLAGSLLDVDVPGAAAFRKRI